MLRDPLIAPDFPTYRRIVHQARPRAEITYLVFYTYTGDNYQRCWDTGLPPCTLVAMVLRLDSIFPEIAADVSKKNRRDAIHFATQQVSLLLNVSRLTYLDATGSPRNCAGTSET